MDTATELMELVSLAATPPFLLLGAVVVWKFSPVAWATARGVYEWKDKHILIVGILIGFMGSLVDNVYWGCAWLAEYMGWGSAKMLFANGVWSNVPFRQFAGIAAAILHLYAVLDRRELVCLMKISGVMFVMTALWLWGSK